MVKIFAASQTKDSSCELADRVPRSPTPTAATDNCDPRPRRSNYSLQPLLCVLRSFPGTLWDSARKGLCSPATIPAPQPTPAPGSPLTSARIHVVTKVNVFLFLPLFPPRAIKVYQIAGSLNVSFCLKTCLFCRLGPASETVAIA